MRKILNILGRILTVEASCAFSYFFKEKYLNNKMVEYY